MAMPYRATAMLGRLRLALAALVSAGALLAAPMAVAGPVVETSSGAVDGTSRAGLRVFLGIPYAKPPVGDLRWRAPVPPERWQGVRPATHFAPSCIQGDPVPFGPYSPPFLITPERSEDCLYLNVWAPEGKGGKRPVYFFIHGGGYQSGGASVPAYDGAALARKGAVVVTINYRLGVFGFFAHPELTRESELGTSGNYGLLDAIAALRWVRGNIARFGGDPANVTIAGQSAGAQAVGDLLMSPLARGLFHRAVIESGPALGFAMPTLAQAEQRGVAAAARLKVDGIAALRAIPATALAKAPLSAIPWPNIDGKVVAADPELGGAAVVNKVPVIAGYTRDERTADAPKTVVAFERDLRSRTGAFADRFLALYPHADDREAAHSAAQFARDRYVAALLLWGERRGAQGEAVYGYLFERPFPGKDADRFGAFHTSEVPYIFGAFDLSGVTFDAEDRNVSDSMQQRWLRFMKTGDPNGAGGASAWPKIGRAASPIWRIAAADAGPAIEPARLQLFRAFAAQGGKLSLF